MAQQVDIIANLLMKVDGAEAGIKKVQSSLSRLKMPNDFNQKFTKSFSNLEGIITRFKNQLNSGFNTKGDVSNITKIAKEMDVEFSRITKNFEEVTGQTIDFKVNSSELIAASKKLEELIAKREEVAKKSISLSVKTESGKTGNVTELLKNIQKEAGNTKAGQYAKEALNAFQTGNITAYTAAVEKLEKAFSNLRSQAKKTADIGNGITMGEGVKAIVAHAEGASRATRQLDKEIEDVKGDIASIQTSQFEKANKVLLDASASADKLGSELSQTGAAARDFANSTYSMNKQLGELQQSTQYFFSLRNMINLLRQGVDQAIESIKNLDKAMTETAVVTDFSVADMWKDLPKYTKLANELGATTQGAYETMTLYYQQGLDQQATFEIGAETMKMARIAGLDYAKTTDMMTAALRGFNMELNEVSAQRINDVYSNLAAKTASNTQEIGEAMERTASIAHSAGMSFEGTAAFLAQMIETTREAPENLGTAMKTIVARFQEMKKNPLEIVDVDGEEVSFNRVDTALKTIGVNLVGTNGQFRALDEVFLDISAKWKTLTQTQQRYIATIAAGSRQQSRFIAMVGDYDRTLELMDYANNSAGASQEQFNKTLDSFEAKMNKLQNAWQQFTMGIANNTFVKGAVDGITLVLETVNDLINTLSGGNGVVKSFLSLFAAFTGLKFAGQAVNGLIRGLGGMLDPTKKGSFGLGMPGGTSNANVNRVTNPIINKLTEILNSINNIKNDNQKYSKYRDKQSALRSLTKDGKINISDVRNQFKGLRGEDQFRLFQTNRGTMEAIRRSASAMMDNTFKDNPEIQAVGKTIQSDIFKGMSEGQVKPEIGLKALGNPGSWGAIAGTDAAKEFSNNYNQRMNEAASKARQSMKYYYKSIERIQKEDPATRKKSVEAYKKEYQKRLAEEKEKLGLGGREDQIQLTKMEKLQNTVGNVGGAFVSAGQSISSFGAVLSQIGGPIGSIGNGLQSLGGIVTNLGMTIAGSVSAVESLNKALKALDLSWKTIGGVALPIAAVAAGMGLLYHHIQKVKKEAKDAAKEVIDNFEKTNEKIQKNQNTLREYRGEWERLVKGVDSNGLNVSLDQVDYDKYLEIAKEIAKINPSLIEGYTSQGSAIITNNRALEETLQLLKQQEKEAVDAYIKPGSLQKLINARNVNKNYNKGITREDTDPASFTATVTYDYWASVYGMERPKTNLPPMAGQVNNIIKALEDQDFFDVDEILSQYGISLQQLANGEQNAINTFVKKQNEIYSSFSEAAQLKGEEATQFIADSLDKPFETLSKDTNKFNKSVEPIVKNLATYVTNSSAYKNIGPEFREAIMMGIQDIAITPDLNATEMQKEVNKLLTEFDNLTIANSEYSEAMKKVEEEQSNFSKTLDKAKYLKNTKGALEDLEALYDKYVDKSDTYSQAVAEFLNNQIEKIKNFTEEGAVSLTEALNTMTSQISAAENAYASFQEATKTDWSTGVENMKSIYEEVFKETEVDGTNQQLHTQGYGDQTLWAGADALLGKERVDKIFATKDGKEAIAAVTKEMKALEPFLKEGEKGARNFWNALIGNKDELQKKIKGLTITEDGFNLDTAVNPDVYHQLATELNMSDETLAAMLNKLNQFTNISFSDLSAVRTALGTDSAVIKGRNQGENGPDLYVKGSYLDNAMQEAHIHRSKWGAKRKELEGAGVNVIEDPDKITKKELKDMGIEDIPSAIEVLGDTGLFNKEEIAEYAKKIEGKGFDEKEYEDRYQEYLDAEEDPSLPTVQSIEGTVQSIYQLLATNLIKSGGFDKSMSKVEEFKNKIQGKEGKNDTLANFFAKGTDSEGNTLSKKEYRQQKAELTRTQEGLEEYLSQLREGKENAKTEEEKKAYQEEIDGINSLIGKLKRAIEQGEKNWKENRRKDKEEKEEKNKEDSPKPKEGNSGSKEKENTEKLDKETRNKLFNTDPGMREAYKYYKKNGFENTGGTREVLDWSTTSKKSLNYKNAKDWVPKEDLKGISTYLSQAWGFGEKGQEFQLAFSPMLQTGSGEPEVLSEETVRNYLNGIIDKSKDENGKVNFDELLKLDQSGIGMVSENGNEISNLIMGLVEGGDEQAEQTAGAIGLLEHYIEEANTQGTSLADYINQNFSQEDTSPEEGIKPKNEGILGEWINNVKKRYLDYLDEEIKKGDVKDPIKKETPADSAAHKKAEAAGEESKKGILAKASEWFKEVTDRVEKRSEKAFNTKGGNGKRGGKGSGTSASTQTTNNQKIETTFKTKVDGEDELEKVKEKGDEATKATDKTTNYKVKVTGEDGIKDATNLANKAQNQTLGISTKVDNKGVTSGIQKINKSSAKIKVGADTSKATKEAHKVVSDINSSKATLDVYMHQAGDWVVNVFRKITGGKSKDGDSGATGINNRISISRVPQFGSAARGKYGTIGPRNKGGLTLTGEKGFEIAWLPSENRSMVVGAKGPQMLNLPSDAVVYTHEQSKKIIKQKSIPAGSHVNPTAGATGGFFPGETGDTSKTDTTTTTVAKNNKETAKNNKDTKRNNKDTKKNIVKIGKVSVWWENIARTTEGVQRKADKAYSEFEKYIKNLEKTLKETGTEGKGNEYILNTLKVIEKNQQQLDKANKQLKSLDTSNKKTTIKYKQGSKTKKSKVKLGDFIKYDEESGSYIIDQKKLNSIAKSKKKGGKEKAKGIKDAATKKIDDKLAKRNKAEDEILKAQEALEKFGEELYENFFKWENELTKIWEITQKITDAEAKRNKASTSRDLYESQIANGTRTAEQVVNDMKKVFDTELSQQIREMELSIETADQQREELNKILNLTDEKATLNKIQQGLIDDVLAGDLANKKAEIENKDEAIVKLNEKITGINTKIENKKAALDKAKTKKEKKKIKKEIKNLKQKRSNTEDEINSLNMDKALAQASYDEAYAKYGNKEGLGLNETQQSGYGTYAKHLEELINLQARTFRDFLSIEAFSDGTISVDFNQEKFEFERLSGELGEEEAGQIQDFVKKIVEASDKLNSDQSTVISNMLELNNKLGDLQSEWVGYAEELWDISDAQQKQEVDNLKKLNDSLTNSLKKLLDDVKKKLDDRRKQEDNLKTEQEISRKQQRLAMLRADTAGGHATEIAQLEKEVAEAQQNYQRSLEDQFLDKLQQQADAAAQQREQQITLQEGTIDAINNAAEVNKWMNDPEKYKETMLEAYKKANDFYEKPIAMQEKILRDFETLYSGLLTNKEEREQTETEIEELDEVLSKIRNWVEDLQTLTSNYDTEGVAKGGTGNEVSKTEKELDTQNAENKYQQFLTRHSKEYEQTTKNWGTLSKAQFESQMKYGKKLEKTEYEIAEDLVNTDAFTWLDVLKAAKAAGKKGKAVKKWNPTAGKSSSFRKAFEKVYGKWNTFAVGGLASYTGPAWLDGTPTKPELVLNAQDTKNFIALKDVLSHAVNSAGSTSQENAVYDIDINVDHINSDYDVDKIAKRVQNIIVEKSSYRNVTQVRSFR